MNAAYYLLGFVVLPLWIAAGLADYLCHRATRISENAGTPESLLHLLQYALVGLPVSLALFLKADAGFFLFAAFMIILHHMVAYVDVRYANQTRNVPPFEQMVHSFLELLPITAYLLLAVASWSQILFPVYTATILTTAFLLNLVPYVEELFRCWRAPHNKG
jgi:hypothetical protein